MSTDHFKMLYDIGELSHLFAASQDIRSFLQKIIMMLAHHMHVAVCSIYIYDDATARLSIKASQGLEDETHKSTSLALTDNIIGTALKEFRPITVRQISQLADAQKYPQLFNMQYDSCLIIPISQGINRIGVMLMQREGKRQFTKEDVASLRVMASQLCTIISHVKMLMTLNEHASDKAVASDPEAIVSTKLTFIKGRSASGGYAYSKSKSIQRKFSLSYFASQIFTERYNLDDFNAALKQTELQLEDLQAKVEKKLSDVASLIFTAHLLILKDKIFINEITALINQDVNVPNAIIATGKKFLDMFAQSSNSLIREKQTDLEDLLVRVLHNLIYKRSIDSKYLDHIIIIKELFPSDILRMSAKGVKGIILISGGITSHVAILARSLHIPLVIADRSELLAIPNDTPVLIDAEVGNLYVNPTPDIIKEFEKQRESYEQISHNKEVLNKSTITKDGTGINIFANINLISDLALAKEAYCDGIGLYRTEFPFLIRPDFPSEEEQYVIYRKLVQGLPKKPITFRTLDLGGDKLLTYYDLKEKNPFLGFRSTRFTLQHPEIFIQQIRAILRAGHGGNIRIMFPMIASMEEFLQARDILSDCHESLKKERAPHHGATKVGIMVEIPSVVDVLDDIAKEVDFFSIGTNDLIQFLLAVDRTNEKVASFYNPLHPSVLRTLKKIVDCATRNKIDVSICGDMAHEEEYLPLLLGIGLRNFSINPIYIPKIKKALLTIDLKKAESLTKHVLSLNRMADIRAALSNA